MTKKLNKDLSFNLQAKDIYEFLKDSYKEFKIDELDKKKALICALLSYHLIEWKLWEDEPDREIDISTKDCTDFINKLESEELKNAFYIIKDLGNGLKHKILSRGCKLKKSDTHLGAFDKSFDPTFDRPYLYVEKGEKHYRFINELEKVVNYWETVYYPTKT